MNIVFMKQERDLQQKLAAPVANEEFKKKLLDQGDRNSITQVVKNSQIDNLSVRAHPAETTKCKTSSDKKMGCCLTEESVFC